MHLIGLDYFHNCRILAQQSLFLLFGTNRWHQVTREEKWLLYTCQPCQLFLGVGLTIESVCVKPCANIGSPLGPRTPFTGSPTPACTNLTPPEPWDISSMPPGQWLVVCPAHFHQWWIFPSYLFGSIRDVNHNKLALSSVTMQYVSMFDFRSEYNQIGCYGNWLKCIITSIIKCSVQTYLII